MSQPGIIHQKDLICPISTGLGCSLANPFPENDGTEFASQFSGQLPSLT
jgi:hypothetical protein